MARWSRVDYAVVAPLNLAVTLIFLSPRARERVVLWMRDASLSRVLPGGALVGGLMGGYFVPGLMGVLGLLLAQAAAYVLLLAVLEGDVDDRQRIGPALTLGLLFFLVANFLNAFAFTYPYTLPAMRGMGWAVYLAAALALSAGIAGREFKRPASGVQLALPLYGYAMLSLLALIFHVWPRSAFPLPESGPLRFATYNIHYGYDEPWHFNLEEQAATIAANEVDVIALQEVDTGRLTSYGVDDAYFLGRRLGMNVAYLPAVEHLTGIAVLHKGKARHVDWRLLTSLQEQTGIVGVELDLGARSIHSFGIWLGLSDEDTERQIAEALAFIGDRTPATFGGDFNAPDDSPVADAIRAAGFDDPFTLLGMAPPPPTSSALDPQKRIDYVWVRGLQPRDAWVDTSVASDHLMVVVEVERP
jgi:endonuclease/exonuclease/phosphatase family metal-dependent hydrolase